ncbi:hypothetical protein H5203_09770 [Pseudoalteromonas sp. SG41-1]|uniref:hypothetical protein n=1 Tax=Pseudoalteromonas sp. SG41-1 TaxID=2760979 RepID=UPI001603A782|nr:hypothetical protein [Pseudoalteromonas sp. SG41-1]MBB1505765.1 hypothetical protein [Pseudoalteromonas sp. SG41-1]
MKNRRTKNKVLKNFIENTEGRDIPKLTDMIFHRIDIAITNKSFIEIDTEELLILSKKDLLDDQAVFEIYEYGLFLTNFYIKQRKDLIPLFSSLKISNDDSLIVKLTDEFIEWYEKQ